MNVKIPHLNIRFQEETNIRMIQFDYVIDMTVCMDRFEDVFP